MPSFSISIDINARVSRVWQVMSDVDRWPEWTASVTHVQRIGGQPLAVGSRAIIEQPKFPPATWKVTELKPGSHFAWVSANPGLRVTGGHRVEPIPTGTRATLTIDLEGPLAGIFWWLTKRISQRYVTLEAEGLKAR